MQDQGGLGGREAASVEPVGVDPVGVEPVDVVVVGAGFGGLYALYELRRRGFRVRLFEAGEDVGGTWYWNRYPGARCDVESVEYSYSFSPELQQEWVWSERYAGQPEILRYLQHVADRFELRPDITFGTRVTAAELDEARARWRVQTDRGHQVTAQFLVMATGPLSAANVPDIPGLPDFDGPTYHTGRWPSEGVDVAGRRVGVIGTGSSGIQVIPMMARQAGELTVFQRTASYTVPAHNRPLERAELDQVKADYAELRARNRAMPGAFGARLGWNARSALEDTPEERRARYESCWSQGGFAFVGAYRDTSVDPKANELAAEFVRAKIREIVHDPATAERLSPRQPISCKRLCVDTGYYETFNRPNVHLVDVGETPIERVVPEGIVVGSTTHPLDAIVLATGYDAMTGSLLRIDIRGRAGESLADRWAAGPVTFLGLGVPGFPNMFVVAGPGSPSVLANMVTAAEQHVDWIGDCLDHLRASGHQTIEARHDAADSWVHHVNTVAAGTLYPTCNSWYLGANIPGKTRVFMPLLGFPAYAERCDQVAAEGYEGFALV